MQPTRFTKVSTSGQSLSTTDPTKNANRGDYSLRTFSFIIQAIPTSSGQLGIAIPANIIIRHVNFNIRTAETVAITPTIDLAIFEGIAAGLTSEYDVSGANLGYRSAADDSSVPFDVRATTTEPTNVTWTLSSATFETLDCEVELICSLAETN